MLSMLRGKKGKKGFTLIELMIVVAIIGILAAIAIPNFLRFQAKSKQSEAKTNLGGIFTAEESHFAEYNTYADLGTVAWAPIGTQIRYKYTLGTANVVGYTGAFAVAPTWDNAPMIDNVSNVSLNYIAGAYGNVDTDDFLDTWSIDKNKDLKNQKNDVNLP
jgi:type IV pilus assembly protein PilA